MPVIELDDADLMDERDAEDVAGSIWSDEELEELLCSPLDTDISTDTITAHRKSLSESTKRLLEELDQSLAEA